MNNFTKIGLVILGLSLVAIFLFKPVTAESKVAEIAVSKSLCTKSEQTIWSCTTTRKKIASVCASKGLTAEKGYVQYRFGTVGKIELELPKSRENSQKFFKYSRYTRPLVTMLQLTFENGDYSYQIHDDDNAEEKPPIRASSIDITKSGSDKTTSIVCKNPTAGSLMKLEDIVPKDEDGIQ